MFSDISWMFELTNLSLADPTNEGYNQKNYVKVSKFSNLINDYNINQKVLLVKYKCSMQIYRNMAFIRRINYLHLIFESFTMIKRQEFYSSKVIMAKQSFINYN